MQSLKTMASTLALCAVAFGAANAQGSADQRQPSGTQQSRAAGDCDVASLNLEQRAQQQGARGAGDTLNQATSLRETAEQLKASGQIAACKQVLAAIEQLLGQQPNQQSQQRSQANQTTQPAQSGQQAQDRQQQNQPRATTPNQTAQADRGVQQRMAQAQELTQMQGTISADQMVGATIYGAQGENLGEIEDVLFEPKSQQLHVVIGTGGFLGVGETRVIVPVAELKLNKQQNEFFAKFDKAAAERQPTVEWRNDMWQRVPG